MEKTSSTLCLMAMTLLASVQSQYTYQQSFTTTIFPQQYPPSTNYNPFPPINTSFDFHNESLPALPLKDSNQKWSVVKHHLNNFMNCTYPEHVYSGITSDVVKVGGIPAVKSIEVFYACSNYVGSVLLTPPSDEVHRINGKDRYARPAVISVVVSKDYDFVAKALGVMKFASNQG